MAKKKQKSKGKNVISLAAKAQQKKKAEKQKQATAAAKLTKIKKPAQPDKAKRFRFRLPTGFGERIGNIQLGIKRSWHELAIKLRLSRVEKEAPPRSRDGKAVLPRRGSQRPSGRRQAVKERTLVGSLRERWDDFGDRHPRFQRAAQGAGGLLKPLATVEGIFAVLLAVLLFYPPYFRGLFFAQELLPTHIFTAMLFAFFASYRIYRRQPLFSRRPLDYAVVLLLVLYATSSIAAWNTREALGAVLKMANYAAVYWLLSYSVQSIKAVRNYLAVFFVSGTGVALLGLGAAIGAFHYNDAFVGGRIYSSLQYPNTLAAFLTAINLCGLYLWTEARPRAVKILFAAGNYLLFLTFLGTQSRGALVFYPLALLILLIGLPGRERWRTLGQFVLQLAASAAVYGRVMACTTGKAQLAGWLWVLAGAVLISLLQLAWSYLEQGAAVTAGKDSQAGRRTLKPWVRPAAGVMIVLVIAAGGYALTRAAATPAAGSQAVWKSWVQRIETISIKEKNAQERIIWSRDAFRIMTSSPRNALLGAGGGGWNALYHKYQDYYYFSTEVHNHFMQVGIETGFPGLLTFIAIWIFFFVSTLRAMRPSGSKPPQESRALSWAVFSGALALGMHSLIDFNLSLGAVAILLWGLFGLGRGLERLSGPVSEPRIAEVKGRARRKQSVKQIETWWQSQIFQGVVVGVLFCACFFTSLTLVLGQKYAQAASESVKGQDVRAAVANLEQAIQHDPWTASYRSDLANLLMYQYQAVEQKDRSLINKVQDNLGIAVRNDRGNAELRLLYAQALFNSARIDEGLEQMEAAADLVPFRQDVYENLAVGYMSAGRFLLEQADAAQGESKEQAEDVKMLREQGRKYLELAVEAPGRLEARMAAVPQKYLEYWTKAPHLKVSPMINLKAGEAAVLLGRWPLADTRLTAALEDPNLKPEAILWRGLALEKQQKDGDGLISEALKLQPELAEERDKINTLLK